MSRYGQSRSGMGAMPSAGIMPSGIAYQQGHQSLLGAEDVEGVLGKMFNVIASFYTVSVELAGTVGATQAGSVPIRPEPFLLKRITWATSGDTPAMIGATNSAGSAQGRSVEVSWEDEFTKFLGSRSCLLSALFADSQGFIDLPRPLLFQGKQSLSVTLRRIFWPAEDDEAFPPSICRFDFSFQGLSLLPQGVNQSGTAG
jgi:hypothetical protein